MVVTTVTVHQAKTHLSNLIERALAGEEVVVMRGRDPVVTLKPIRRTGKKRRLGGVHGIIEYMADDFNAPLSDFVEYTK